MRDTERGKDIGKGRSRLLAGSLMWNLIHTSCREPDMGLDPGSPGPGPRLKAALNG